MLSLRVATLAMALMATGAITSASDAWEGPELRVATDHAYRAVRVCPFFELNISLVLNLAKQGHVSNEMELFQTRSLNEVALAIVEHSERRPRSNWAPLVMPEVCQTYLKMFGKEGKVIPNLLLYKPPFKSQEEWEANAPGGVCEQLKAGKSLSEIKPSNRLALAYCE